MANSEIPPKRDVYMYGMVVQSTIHKLSGAFPAIDTYGEIEATHYIPGGEAGNSAVILNSLGYKVKLEAPLLGTRTREPVTKFYTERGIDVSGMKFDPSFPGVEDLVLVADDSRTVFGTYAHYFTIPEERWQEPDEDAVEGAKIVGLDPFFKRQSETVAQLCVKHDVPYVTIDCPPDSFMSRRAAAIVVSNEYIKGHHKDEDVEALHRRYTDNADGLVIFTFGGREIVFGRKGGAIGRAKPFNIKVVNTLGARDTFRAGVMHGILQKMPDEQVVEFAAATAACVCMRFPFGFNPPTLADISGLIASRCR
jgi:sugar/nucleoside kinase (ribokinase family)